MRAPFPAQPAGAYTCVDVLLRATRVRAKVLALQATVPCRRIAAVIPPPLLGARAGVDLLSVLQNSRVGPSPVRIAVRAKQKAATGDPEVPVALVSAVPLLASAAAVVAAAAA